MGFVLVGAATLGVAERESQACSCFGSSELVAPVGDTHPLGAALAFESWCGGSPESWSATIDGEPAMIVGGDLFQGVGTVQLEPAPGLGAEVVLFQDCNAGFDLEGCIGDDGEVERTRFVIGPADDVAPAPGEVLELEHERGEFSSGCDELREGVTISAVVDFPTIEPGAWAYVWFERDGDTVQSESRRIPENGELSAFLFLNEDEADGPEVCVGARAIDASLNASEDRTECTAVPPANGRGCAIASDSRWSALALVVLVRRRRR